MTSDTTLIVLSGLVIFSYLFELIGGKTKVPSVILLMCLGILIKQVADYFGFHPFDFNSILPTLGTLGLVLIVFEGALELRYSKDKNSVIKRSFFSALIILLATTFAITGIIYYISGQDIYHCFINAIPFCVISSSVAIPATANIGKEKREFIVYESSFSDILTVVLFNFMVNNKHIGFSSFTNLAGEFGIIIIVVICSCLLLLYLIGRLTHHVKSFLVISILILVYSIGQVFHLSSLVIVLALGLFLNNASQIRFPLFRKYFIYPKLKYDIKQLFQLSAESAFIMRTFFFIMFGYTMDIYQLQNWSVLLSGGAMLLAIYLVRLLYIKLVSKTDLMPELVLIPRGLISVLLYYSLPPEMKIKGVETGLLFVVILGTSVILSLGLLATKSRITTRQGSGDFES
jgi:NhaP-type Na+/H+ and K+/H+ antiporter